MSAKKLKAEEKKSFRQGWAEKSKGQKAGFIVRILIIAASVVFIALALFAKQIFGADSVMGTIIGSGDGGFKGIWEAIKSKLPTLLKSITLIIITLAVSYFVRLVLRKILSLGKKGRTIVKLLDSFIKYAAAIILVFLILSAWGIDTSTLVASAGIIGLVIGLGAQSLISDLISGVFLVFEGDFQVGDIIVIDDFRGTVQSIGMRTIKILTPLGDLKVINNSDIRNFVNMSKYLSVAVCDLTLEYMVPVEKAEEIIKANLDAIADRLPTIVEGPTYLGVASLSDGGVVFKIIAKCKEEDRFQTVRGLNREFKILFDNNGISTQPTYLWADPTTYVKPAEGPEALKK